MNTNPIISLVAGEDIDSFLRVKVNGSGQAVLADASDTHKFIGHVLQDAKADPNDDAHTEVAVQLKGTGISYAVAADAISQGGEFEAADDGKIKANTGTALGQVLQASSTSGDQVRVIYY